MAERWSPMTSPAVPGSPPSASTTSATRRDAGPASPSSSRTGSASSGGRPSRSTPPPASASTPRSASACPARTASRVQASAAGLYFLVADGEAEPEVYVAAAARNQAGIVLGQSRRMAQQSPRLRAPRHASGRTLIECPRNGGLMRALSADAALQHGLNP